MKKTFSKNEIPNIAQEIVGSLSLGDSATIIALSGDLGAGKTTLTQSIAKELGIKANIISPTFVIMKNYFLGDSLKNGFDNLVHIDAYRLDSSKELLTLGWNEIISNPKNLILIEWPEKVADVIPSYARTLTLTHIDSETREINL